MMALTAVAKFLGMLRTARIAALFGAGMEAEALAAAGRLPNLLMDIFPAAAVSGCFMPVLCQKGTDKRGFTACFGTVFFLILTLMALLCGLLAVPLTGSLFPGLSEEAASLTCRLLPRYALTLIPMGGAAILTAVCQVKGHYLIPPVACLLANGGELAVLYRSPALTPDRVSTLRLCAACLLCAILLYPLRKGNDVKVARGILNLKKAWKRFPASLIASLLLPISLGAATAASSFVMGGTALFGYAATLFSAVLGITASGIVNYSLPKMAAESDDVIRRQRASSGLLAVFVIALPLALCLCLLSHETVSLIFHHGRMHDRDILWVSRTLSLLSLCLPFCVAEDFLSRYALLIGKKAAILLPPLWGGASAIILSLLLREQGPVGGALAFLLCHLLSVLLLFFLLRRELPVFSLRSFPYLLWGLAAVCLVYQAASRLSSPSDTVFPLPFLLIVAFSGGTLYLTICRFTLGRERSDPPS